MSKKTITTIEVNKEVWLKVRVKAWAEGLQVSEALEKVLKEYFESKGASK